MMWRVDDGGWMGWWWVFMPILFIALVAVIIWAVVALTRSRPGDRQPPRDPPQILAERFARGEIDEAAFWVAAHRLDLVDLLIPFAAGWRPAAVA